MTSPPNPSVKEDSMEKVRWIVEAAHERKAQEVVALDVRGVASFADAFVIATGTSDRHVLAVVEAIADAGRQHGSKPLGIEGQEDARWVLLDMGDVIVHVFLQDVRAHYDLERLWSDAAQIRFEGLPEPGATP